MRKRIGSKAGAFALFALGTGLFASVSNAEANTTMGPTVSRAALGYAAKLSDEQLISQLKSRPVTYLLGITPDACSPRIARLPCSFQNNNHFLQALYPMSVSYDGCLLRRTVNQ